MQKTPIVILTTFYKPFISGAELCVQELADRHGDRQIVVIAGLRDRSLPRRENDNGVTIIRVGVGHLWDKVLFPFLCVIPGLKLKPQIVHAVMESHAAMGLILIKWLRPKIRAVLTLQSGNLDEDPKLRKWPMSWLWKKIHTTPDEVTAISQFLADRAIKIRNGGSVEVIPNGVDLNLVKGLTEQKIPNRIVCIARYSKEKGVDILIKAFALVLKQVPQAELCLVGYGDEQSSLEQLAKDQGCSERVTFTGKKDHEGAMRVLRTGSVFSLLSRGEGQGIVLLEAAAAGLPTVATRVGGIPEAMIDGKTGYLVERDDYQAAAEKLIVLLKDQQLADQMGREGQLFAENFDWAACISKYHVLWDRLGSQKRIVFASSIYPPDIGGPAGYVKGFSTELVKMGHAPFVVAYGDKPEKINEEFSVIRVGRKTALRFWSFFHEVYKQAKGSDVVYAMGAASDGFPAYFAARLRNARFVIKVVGDQAWEKYQTQKAEPSTLNPKRLELLDEFVAHKHSGSIRILEGIERFVAKRSDAVIVPSKYLKTIVEKWGVKPDKVKVIYNSISPLALTADREQIRQEFGLVGKKAILTAVRAVPWKNVDFLVSCIADLPSEYILIVAGDGPLLEDLKRFAETKNVSSRVKFLGRVSRDQMAKWYATADVFALPSGYEGFPHVVVEAISKNLFCLVSDRGGNPETAELFPGCVKVLPYLDQRAWVEALQAQNSISGQNISQNSFEDMAKSTLEILVREI